NARFGLYLLPFYAAAAATVLARGCARIEAAGRRFAAPARVAIAALLVASAVAAAITITGLLSAAPREVRKAGAALARLGAPGDPARARRPGARAAGWDAPPGSGGRASGATPLGRLARFGPARLRRRIVRTGAGARPSPGLALGPARRDPGAPASVRSGSEFLCARGRPGAGTRGLPGAARARVHGARRFPGGGHRLPARSPALASRRGAPALRDGGVAA